MLKPLPTAFDIKDASWTTISGPAGDGLHVSFVDINDEHYTLLRDDKNTVLAYDEGEWAAFVDGIHKGEFR